MTDFVYIMSPSYSGSTLLTFLLATHPSIATVGELKARAMGDIDQYHCSCGHLIRQCPFWQQVADGFARRGETFDVSDFGTDLALPGQGFCSRVLRARVRGGAFEFAREAWLRAWPPGRAGLHRVLDRNRAFVEVVHELTGRPVFLDSSKDPVRLRLLQAAGYWNVKVIYLVRDGRGTACSHMRHYSLSMREAAAEWRQAHEECARMLDRLPRQAWMRMRYEDLCREPDATMDQAFEFLGLDPVPAARDFRAVEHHIVGNFMRLDSSSEIRMDTRWQSTLQAEHLEEFQQVAGPLNRWHGYE